MKWNINMKLLNTYKHTHRDTQVLHQSNNFENLNKFNWSQCGVCVCLMSLQNAVYDINASLS